MGFVAATLKYFRRIFLGLVIIFLLASNVLTLASAAFHSAMYGLLAALPVEHLLKNSPTNRTKKVIAERNKLLAKKKSARAAALKTRKRVFRRSQKMVARNIAQIPVEALPLLGVGVVVATTALDVKDACDTSNDINQLLRELDIETDTEETFAICNPGLPDSAQIQEAFESTRQEFGSVSDQHGGFMDYAQQRVRESWTTFYDALGEKLYLLLN